MIRINKKIVFLCIVTFIFAYLSGGNLPYSVFYVFLVSIVFGMIYILKAKKNLNAKFKCENNIYNVCDVANISIIVENSGNIPTPYIFVESKILSSLIEGYRGDLIFLGLGESRWINNNITFKKRGIYNFGDISIETNDIFHIYKLVKNIHNELYIKVYPKVYDLSTIRLSGGDNFEDLINSKSGNEDFTLIKDTRKYNLGDSLKKVHWKLSAKHGELYVRNFDTISSTGCNLFINMHIENLGNDLFDIIEEYMVDFSISLSKYMVFNKIKTKLFINAKQGKNIGVESKEDFLRLMEYFLRAESDGTLEFTSFIKSNLINVSKGNWIGIIIITIDDNLRDMLINLKGMGYRVNVFYYGDIVNITTNTDIIININILKNLGIDCIDFKEALEKVNV